jgi:phage baseplate assembly protein W
MKDIKLEMAQAEAGIRRWERRLKLATTKIHKLRQKQKRLMLAEAARLKKQAEAMDETGRSISFEEGGGK